SRQHELVAGADGGYTLKIQGRLAHGATSAEVKPVAASAVPKLMLASAPAASTPTTTVPASAPAAASTDKPADFAFVEPKYSAKPANEPAAKAEEAARRLADKTAAELVATNANAT